MTDAIGSGASGGAGATTSKKGGPPIWFAVFAILGILAGAVLVAFSVLGIGVRGSAAAPTLAPAGAAAARTHDQVKATLEAAAFQVQDPNTPYRPGESPALINVPRSLLQVIIPSVPRGGYIVVYELPTANDADRVGSEFLRYLASGTGAVQYPRDTRFVLQRIAGTLVFYAWSAEATPDPEVARVADVLGGIGTAVKP